MTLEPHLVRMIYRSRSGLRGTASEIEAALEQILQAARRRNTAADVTGALMFTQLMFVQVLEGPAESVEEVFERISRDLRHTAVEIIEYGVVEERGYGAWSMRHLVPEADAGMITDGSAEDTTEAARLGLTLMRALLRADADRLRQSALDAA